MIATHRRYLQDGHDLFCSGLLEEYEALWSFCAAPGIDPTNNAAERALRHAVIMRKVQGGTQP